MKKVLAFMGSMRRNSNTEKSLDIFLNENFKDESYEKIIIKNLNFSDCISCYGCAKVPECIVKDDLTPIYKKFEEADVIVMASPIYFNTVSGVAKNFIDRLQVYWCRKYKLNLPPIKEKIGISIINGGAPYTEDQFIGTEMVLDHFYRVSSCKTNYTFEIPSTDVFPIEDNEESYLKLIDKFKSDKPGVYRINGDEINEFKQIY